MVCIPLCSKVISFVSMCATFLSVDGTINKSILPYIWVCVKFVFKENKTDYELVIVCLYFNTMSLIRI